MRSDSKLLEAFAPLHPFLSETVQQPLNFRPFCALEEKCRVCYGVLPYASGILEKTDETEVQQSAGVSYQSCFLPSHTGFTCLLVKQLAIKGWIVTIDAMETQTKIAERIIEFEGDNVLTESFKLIVFRSGQSAGNMVQLGYTK